MIGIAGCIYGQRILVQMFIQPQKFYSTLYM